MGGGAVAPMAAPCDPVGVLHDGRSRHDGYLRPGARPEGRPSRLAGWLALAYGLVAALGAILAVAFGKRPLSRAPWLPTAGVEAVVASLVLGGAFAALVIIATRRLVARAGWARALHVALRPFVRSSDDAGIALMALASGVAEELFFRGFLSVVLGVWLSSVLFGALHQVRGAGRWGWAASAFAVGLGMAVIYALTGQLAGCIAAHAAINFVNLRYLRDNDPDPPPRRKLGGLLGHA